MIHLGWTNIKEPIGSFLLYKYIIFGNYTYNNNGVYMNNYLKRLIFLILLIVFIYLITLIKVDIINLLNFIFRIILPFLIAFTLAFLLQPVVRFLNKYLKKRIYSVIITLVIFVLIIYFVFSLIIPFFIKELKSFMDNYDYIINSLEERLNTFGDKFDFLPEGYRPNFENIKNMITDYFGNIHIVPEKIVTKLFDYVSVIIIIPMTLIYFLIDYEKLTTYIKNKLIEKDMVKFKNYLSELNKSLSRFVKTTLLIMFIIMILSTVALWICGLDYPLLFGFIIAITNLIPYFGPYIGGAFPVLYALIDSTSLALIVLFIILVIQILESDVISPYLHSKNSDLHPILVIFGIVLFGKLFGIIGMVVAVPLLSMLRITLKHYPIKLIKKV